MYIDNVLKIWTLLFHYVLIVTKTNCMKIARNELSRYFHAIRVCLAVAVTALSVRHGTVVHALPLRSSCVVY